MRRGGGGGGRIFVILGLVLALVAGGGVFLVLSSATPQSAAPKTTDIVIAVQAIPAKSEVGAEQLQVVQWPVDVPTPVGAVAAPTEVAGSYAVVGIQPQQVVTHDMLVTKDATSKGLGYASLLIEKGSVAVAFPVGPATNVADAIQPGDYVDIIATFTAQAVSANGQPIGTTQTVTQRLLTNILVLNIGSWPPPGSKAVPPAVSGGMVTFQLKEQDVLVLRHAMAKADSLALVLRAANDTDAPNLEPVTVDYINKRFGFKFGQ
ncbi:MAG: Flp pilus assembly protein CpaB [Anaerolineae bacterium]